MKRCELPVGILLTIMLIGIAVTTCGWPVMAQQSSNPLPATEIMSPISGRSQFEFYLTLYVLGFGALVMLMQCWLLRRVSNLSADGVARVFAVTLLLVGGLMIVSAGYSAEEVAPVIGLFGTVAGYLLGQLSQKAVDQQALTPNSTNYTENKNRAKLQESTQVDNKTQAPEES